MLKACYAMLACVGITSSAVTVRVEHDQSRHPVLSLYIYCAGHHFFCFFSWRLLGDPRVKLPRINGYHWLNLLFIFLGDHRR